MLLIQDEPLVTLEDGADAGKVPSVECRMLDGVTYILVQNSTHIREEIGLHEDFVGALVRPGADEAGFVAVAKPKGNLLDARLLERVWQSCLAEVRWIAWHDVAASVGHPREGGGKGRGSSVEGNGKRNDAGAADEVINAGLLGPA